MGFIGDLQQSDTGALINKESTVHDLRVPDVI